MNIQNRTPEKIRTVKVPAQTKTPAEKSAAKVSAQTKNREVNLKVLLPTIVLDCLDQATNHDNVARERFIKEAIREKMDAQKQPASRRRPSGRKNRGEVTVRLPAILREKASAEAVKCGENIHSFMVDSIRGRAILGDFVNVSKKAIGRFYNRLRLVPYREAVSELLELSFLVPYHPELHPFTDAIHKISEADRELQTFQAVNRAMSGAGKLSAQSDEERAASQWFDSFYRRVQRNDLLSAQLDFSGFHPWIKHQVEYQEVAAALAKFNAASTVLDTLLDDGQQEGGAE